MTFRVNPTIVRPVDSSHETLAPASGGTKVTSGSTPRLASRTDEHAARLIGFRRALTAGCVVWTSFLAIDFLVIKQLHAGNLQYFLLLRVAPLILAAAVLACFRRSNLPSQRMYTIADGLSYSAGSAAMALMCVEFRGIASPYVAGFCLVLFSRTVVAPDPWRRGLLMNGLPVLTFFTVLLGSAAFSSRIASQLHDPASVTMLLLGASYVLGTYLFLVINGHIVWSLRRQIFEARNLGRYRLKRRLGAGGMGEVWVAYHPGLKRDVAVKILKPAEQERSASALSRFEREVRATAELMHPNTIRVFDYGMTEDGLWYYVMELLEGETLAQHVTHFGPVAPARALHIAGQAARALAEAHDRGIVHRDVKPENLFLTSLGGEHDFVKIIDFGIAKVQTPDVTVTGTGWVLGTPAYLSPEVAMGQVADARSDVYALGAVLYFLLCGKPPFESDNPSALAYAHVHETPVPPSRKLGRQLPPDVESAVMRALEKERGARFPTAAEFAIALATCTLARNWSFHEAALVSRRSSWPAPSSLIQPVSLPAPPKVPDFDATGEQHVVTLSRPQSIH